MEVILAYSSPMPPFLRRSLSSVSRPVHFTTPLFCSVSRISRCSLLPSLHSHLKSLNPSISVFLVSVSLLHLSWCTPSLDTLPWFSPEPNISPPPLGDGWPDGSRDGTLQLRFRARRNVPRLPPGIDARRTACVLSLNVCTTQSYRV